jgi:hypothetical protein
MSQPQSIIAYLHKGEWLLPAEVETKRHADKGAYVDALPYTVSALRNRRDNGKDTPFWIDLDKIEKPNR